MLVTRLLRVGQLAYHHLLVELAIEQAVLLVVSVSIRFDHEHFTVRARFLWDVPWGLRMALELVYVTHADVLGDLESAALMGAEAGILLVLATCSIDDCLFAV